VTVSREPGPRNHQAGDIHFRKEMALTPKEFLRSLSKAIEGRDLRIVHDDEVIIREADRCIAIRLREQAEHLIGALRLPRTRVEFRFSGYSRTEADTLMTHIDRHFQRGGG
jgi:hypothetical protein